MRVLVGLFLISVSFVFHASATKSESPFKTQLKIAKRQARTSKQLSDIVSSDDFDKQVRALNGTSPVTVSVEVEIIDLGDFSDVYMDYTMTIKLTQSWIDPRLRFGRARNKKEGLSLPSRRIQKPRDFPLPGPFAAKIWVPDLVLGNDKGSTIHDITEINKMLRVMENGLVTYGIVMTSTLSCAMDFKRFPHDKQDCSIFIRSFGYPLSEVALLWKHGRASIRGASDLHLPDLYILDYTINSTHVKLGGSLFDVLRVKFQFRRKIGHYVLAVYIPSVLTVILSWANFWLDIETNSARIGLGIMVVLTMQYIDSSVRQTLPQVSYAKAIDIYLLTSFCFCFATVIEYMFIDFIYWRVRNRKKNAKKEQSHGLILENENASIRMIPTEYSDWGLNRAQRVWQGNPMSTEAIEHDVNQNVATNYGNHTEETDSDNNSSIEEALIRDYYKHKRTRRQSFRQRRIGVSRKYTPRARGTFTGPITPHLIRQSTLMRNPQAALTTPIKNEHSKKRKRSSTFLRNFQQAVAPLNEKITIKTTNERNPVAAIDKWCRYIIPILYIIFNIGYFIQYTSVLDDGKHCNNNSPNTVCT